ncbi:MAG: radical SAM protein [Nitrospinae bacterium]|nr:radical SAM protein [Nitrospinota bacterium]
MVANLLFFEDDIFIIDKVWLEEFAEKFRKQVNIPFICYGRANIIDEESVKLLKKAGCVILRMAIEAGNDEIRNTLLKRKMSREMILKASEQLHENGIKLSVSNMIGLPTETIESVKETLQLNIDCKADNPTAQYFMPYPKMELTRIAIEKGYFDETHFDDIHKNTWKFTPLHFENKTQVYFKKIQKLFTLFVLFPHLRRFEKLFFLLPTFILYIISVVVRIWVTKNYLPKTNVSIAQRLRFLIRFIQYYG